MGLLWYCLYQFTLKNCPDARRSKPPIETVGGRHTGDLKSVPKLSAEAAATTPQMGIFQR